jgi:hypothetical protein
MDINISEYTPDVILPQYKKTNYSLDLELAVIGKKNQQQQAALDTIDNLQQQSLNISMLNMEGRERLDEYNQELKEKLSGDLGDLTKPESQNKVADLFQRIAGDSELKKASRLSQQYQLEFDSIQQMKASGRKDSGYSSINEQVWLNWDNGYYDFMQKKLSDVTSPGFKPTKYTPYKDLRVPLANLSKLLHEDVVTREQQTLDAKGQPTGYLTKHTYGGVSPERVRALYEEQLGPDGIAQLETMSKYEILKARNSGNIESLYNQYRAHSDKEKVTYTNYGKEMQQRLDYNNSKLKQSGLSEEDKQSILAENAAYERNLKAVDSNLKNIDLAEKSPEDFMKLTNDELLGYAYQINKAEHIQNAVNAFSWKKDLQTLDADTTYLAMKKIDAMLTQTRIREEGSNNRMKLSHTLKAASDKKSKEDNPVWSDGDISKNSQDLLSSYDRLRSVQDAYAKSTDNLFEAPSFDPSQLKEQKWKPFFEQNKDNYYVQMWDVFKTSTNLAYDVNGNPKIESFRMWLADQEKSPNNLTAAKVNQAQANRFVADYLTDELGKVDGAIRASVAESKNLIPYMRTSDGQQLSEQDFYAGKEAYVWVPTQFKNPNGEYRGNYMKKSLKEVVYDYQNAGTIDEVIDDGRFKTTVTKPKPTYIDNDPGLKQAISNYVSKSTDPALLSTLSNKLVQFQQFGYSQTSDPDEIAKYEGQISSSAKVGSDSFRTLLGSKGIETIAIPKGAGNKGIVKFKSEYAKELADSGIQLPTADGNVMETVVPGRAYLFDTQPLDARDVMMNLAAQNRPYVKTYKGFKYEIKPQNDGTKVVVVTNPDGTTLPPQLGGNSNTDINEVIRNVEAYINTKK